MSLPNSRTVTKTLSFSIPCQSHFFLWVEYFFLVRTSYNPANFTPKPWPLAKTLVFLLLLNVSRRLLSLGVHSRNHEKDFPLTHKVQLQLHCKNDCWVVNLFWFVKTDLSVDLRLALSSTFYPYLPRVGTITPGPKLLFTLQYENSTLGVQDY